MFNNTNSTAHTETVSIDAPPAAVMAIIGDPEQLPRWAPQFARSVRRDGEHWVVTNGDGELTVRIRVVGELGTVDYLALGAEVGAFSRVVPAGRGSEFTFTIAFAPDATEEQRDGQRAVIASELATVRALAEGG
jgi:hypothetical protein